MEPTESLTAEQLSHILNISEFTVLKLARAGQLPCHYNGRQPRFNLDTLLDHFRLLEGGAA